MKTILVFVFLFSVQGFAEKIVSEAPYGNGVLRLTNDGRLRFKTKKDLIMAPDRLVDPEGYTKLNRNDVLYDSMLNISGRIFLAGQNGGLYLVGPGPLSSNFNGRVGLPFFLSAIAVDAVVSSYLSLQPVGLIIGAMLGVYEFAGPQGKVFAPVTRLKGFEMVNGRSLLIKRFQIKKTAPTDVIFETDDGIWSARDLLAMENCQTFLDPIPRELCKTNPPTTGGAGFATGVVVGEIISNKP